MASGPAFEICDILIKEGMNTSQFLLESSSQFLIWVSSAMIKLSLTLNELFLASERASLEN